MNPELGKLISGEAYRDAIHVAVAPAVAAEQLNPGQTVGRTDSGSYAAVNRRNALGIVDPFLEAPVPEGAQFWLVLFPGTVTGMRHEWQHPMFVFEAPPEPASATEDPKAKARAVIQRASDFLGFSVQRVLDAAQSYAESGGGEGYETQYEYDNTETYKDYEFGEEFWAAVVELTGCKMPKWKGAPYTCSC